MKIEALFERIDVLLQEESDAAKARVAARILNDIDPSDANLRAFAETLDDDIRGELACRAEEWE